MSPTAVWLITSLLFLAGLVGIIVPMVPGLLLIVAGILFYGFVTNFATLSAGALLSLAVIALLATAAEYIGSAVGARAGGGKRLALLGTIVGAIMGLLVAPPIGPFIGAFLGAFAGAIAEGNSAEKAGKVALWSVVGIIGGTFVQLILGVILILIFLGIVLV